MQYNHEHRPQNESDGCACIIILRLNQMTLREEEWLFGIDINLHIYIDTDFIYLRI